MKGIGMEGRERPPIETRLDRADWGREAEAIERYLFRHGLAPWAHLGVSRLSSRDRVPAALRSRLRGAAVAAWLSNRERSEKLWRIGALLRSEKIPFRVLKGAFLMETVLPPEARAMDDIDILVRRHDSGRAAVLLRSMGYRMEREEDRDAIEVAKTEFKLARIDESGRIDLVEIHWDLTTEESLLRGIRIPESLIWENAMVARRGRLTIFGLSAAMQLLYGAVHLAKHLYAGRRWNLDLDAIIRRYACGPFWEQVIEGAEQASACTALAVALRQTAAVFGTRIPPSIAQAVGIFGARARLISGWLGDPLDWEREARGPSDVVRVGLKPLLADRPLSAARSLGWAFWPSAAWIRTRTGATGTSAVLRARFKLWSEGLGLLLGTGRGARA